MLTRRPRIPLALAVLTAAGLAVVAAVRFAPEAVGQPAKGGNDEAGIKQAATAYLAALTAGDLDAVMAHWDEDADYIAEDGTVTRGKAAITALFKATFPKPKGTKFDGKTTSLKFLRGEIALQDGTLTVTDPDGTAETSRYAIVWTKAGGKWLLSSVRDLPAEVVDVPSAAYPQLKALEWLVGEWTGEGAADIKLTAKWAENKAFLLMEYTVHRAGADPMTVSQRIGWDPHNGLVRSWVFDSQGGFGEGYWSRAGRVWSVGSSGVLPDGGTGEATNSYEFKDDNAFVWKATDREVDGQPLADVEVKFVRAPAKK
jgi:uncharacterized protein (TIGR02246 family)